MWFLNLITFGFFNKEYKRLEEQKKRVENLFEETEKKISEFRQVQRLVTIEIRKEDDPIYIADIKSITTNPNFIYAYYSAVQELYQILFSSNIEKETAENVRQMVKGINFFNTKLVEASKKNGTKL